jgi:excinuclease ABC subunit C
MDRFKFITLKNIDKLPKTAGVYVFRNGKQILYIGKAINIKSRVKNHFQQPSYRDNLFMDQINKIGFFETDSEIEALILEAHLIKKYQPKYNVVWRDDKNYFYVAVSQNSQKIPYVFITHQKNYAKTEYIGPFVEGTPLKKTLRFLRRAFPYYTSAKHPKTKCTWCHLDLCPGPRLFEARLDSPKGEAADLIANYKKDIKKLILILKGKRVNVVTSLRKEMKQLSRDKKYEEASKIRDRIYALQQIMAHTHVISGQEQVLTPPTNASETLAKIIELKKPINKIECYDVSNIQGKLAVSSMVVFVGGQPDKSQYKKFKIKMKNEPNDIAMLKETFERRFKHSEWIYPDAMLIDGGKAQLNAAINAKNKNKKTKNIKVISIAKGRQELFIENKQNPISLKSLPQEVYNLIKQLDDEAHRFAITYHKKLRKKNLIG